jgi:hypothetical protein
VAIVVVVILVIFIREDSNIDPIAGCIGGVGMAIVVVVILVFLIR